MTLGLVPPEPLAEAVVVEVVVRGQPKPKGSMRGFADPYGHVHVVPDNPRDLKAWSSAIRHAAETAMADRPVIRGPVKVQAAFTLLRPRGHYGAHGLLPSAPAYPTTKPDGDKLERACWDALKGVVWTDDALVVEWHGRKAYGEVPGLHLRVTAL